MIKVVYWDRPNQFNPDVIYHVKTFKKWTIFKKIWLCRISILYDQFEISIYNEE